MPSVSPDSASAKRSKQRPLAAPPTKNDKPRRRWPRRLAIALTGYAILMWALPILLGWTPLRDRALAMALPGLNGTITSGGASLGWFSPVVFTDVEIRDPAGKVLVSAAKVSTDKSLLRLALSQTDLGTIRIEKPSLALVVRNDGSNAEDVLVPFLKSGNGGGPLTVTLEFVDGTIDMHDVATERRWKIDAFQTSLRLEPKNPIPLECSISGTVELDKPSHFALGYKQAASRTALASGVGGQESGVADAPVDVQARIEPLPLEIFRPVVARLLPEAQVSGVLSANLRYQTVAAQPTPKSLLQGSVDVRGLDLSAPSLRSDHLRLAVLQVPCQITWQGKQVDVQQLGIQCDVGQVSLSGQTTLPDKIAVRSLADWLRETFSLDADLDLAKLARLLPETLHVREQVSVTSGNVHLTLASGTDSGAHRWTGQLRASNITATNAGRPISWNQPISVNFAAHDTPTGPVVENLDCLSSFVQMSARGTPDRFTAKADCDLNRLAGELGQFVDLGGVKPAGGGQATLDWQRATDGSFHAIATCSLNDLQLAIAGRTWNEPLLAATLNATGQIAQSGGARIDTASLDVNDNPLVGVSPAGSTVPRGTTPAKRPGGDHLTVQLLEPVANVMSLATLGKARFAVTLQGELAHWQARLSPWVSLGSYDLGGACDLSAQIASSAGGLDLQQVHATVNRFHAWGGGVYIDDPAVQLDGAASWDATGRTLKIAPTSVVSSAIGLKTGDATLRLPDQGPPSLAGALTWQADLARLTAWLHDPRTQPALSFSGRFSGQANVNETASITTTQLSAVVENLAVVGVPASSGAAARAGTPTAWREQKLTILAAGKYDRAADGLNLDSFEIASSALHFKGVGNIAQLSGRRDADFTGQLDYDWQTLGPLLRPYLGSQVQLAGRESRQFSLHGPLAAAVTPANSADSLAWLKPLAIEAGSGWSSASVGGFQLGPAQFDAHVADGTLSLLKPLQMNVSDGQLIVSPHVRLSPGPALLTLDKGPLLRQVRLSQEMCSQWLRYVSPLAHQAARAQGQFSIDLQGGRVPLADPKTCDVAGKLTIISADINPGPIIHPFALLGRQVRAILQGQPPPLTAGSDQPLVHYPPQTVDFRVINQRVYHDRIEMDIGDLVIRTRGSVGLLDESLVLEAEIPLKSAPPLLGPNSKQPPQEKVVIIPIEGTLGNPKFPPGTIEKLAAQIVTNSTRNTIRGGIDVLDGLFQPKK